jgi:hypothetical protein
MRRLLIAAGLAVLPAGVPGVAGAQVIGDELRAALGHVGQAFAGAQLCTAAELDKGNIALAYAAYGIDLDQPRQFAIVKGKFDETVAAWRSRSGSEACVAAMALYGPEGENVRGLLKWK